MIASPNAAQFVFDGDDSDGVGEGPGPEGSAQIERDITAFLDRQGKPHEGTDFDGRSDYGPFVEAGIPAGGTFTGAEGLKTKEQAKRYGGTAGEAYDPCYHSACDDLKNISMKAFDTNIDVIAHAVGTYAHDLSSLGKPVKQKAAPEVQRHQGEDHGPGPPPRPDRVGRTGAGRPGRVRPALRRRQTEQLPPSRPGRGAQGCGLPPRPGRLSV